MARVYAAAVVGVEVKKIEIETVVQSGFSGLNILGLPGDASRDLRERVRSALESAGLPLPARRTVVSLSPASTLKSMRPPFSSLDFAVAACIAMAFAENENVLDPGQPFDSNSVPPWVFALGGELSLDGSLKPMECALAFEKMLLEFPNTLLCLPAQTSVITLSSEIPLFFKNLRDWLIHFHVFFKKNLPLQFFRDGLDNNQSKNVNGILKNSKFSSSTHRSTNHKIDDLEKAIGPILGTPHIAAALLIAAAGRHHLLLAGQPGVGKTFAAKVLRDLLPPLRVEEWIELRLLNPLWENFQRPLCMPHHSASSAALIGGASLQPGEITLAHGGCLLLDELAEFGRQSLEALREPLDNGWISVSRAQGRMRYPAGFQLIATTNPCPCGYRYSRKNACRCNLNSIQKYHQKFSGPLLDRLCMSVWMPSHAERERDEPDPVTLAFLKMIKQGQLRNVLERVIQLQTLSFSGDENIKTSRSEFKLSSSQWNDLQIVAKTENLSTRSIQKTAALGATIQFLLGDSHKFHSDLDFITGVLAFRCMEKKLSSAPESARRIWTPD